MKIERITISYNRILQRIYLHSYYTGEARKAGGVPPHLAATIQASDSNSDILTQLIDSSIAETTNTLTRYLGICTAQHDNEKAETALSIEIPENYPRECLQQIAQAIEEYATMRALGQWLIQNKPDEAVAAVQETQMAAMRLRELMSLRKRPCKHPSTPDNNIAL